jgi:hypothetical protein
VLVVDVVPDPPQAARSTSALNASRYNQARLKYFLAGTVPEVIDVFISIIFSHATVILSEAKNLTNLVRGVTVYLPYLPWQACWPVWAGEVSSPGQSQDSLMPYTEQVTPLKRMPDELTSPSQSLTHPKKLLTFLNSTCTLLPRLIIVQFAASIIVHLAKV